MPSSPSQTTAQLEVSELDPIWANVRQEAADAAADEPVLGTFLYAAVSGQKSLDDAIVRRIAQRIEGEEIERGLLSRIFQELLTEHEEIPRAFRADLAAVFDRDPACARYIEPLLYFKGFHALATYRFAHALWKDGRRDLSYYLQSQASKAFSIDIHPAARIGVGLMLDHGHSLVFGETSAIGDNVSILHGVTLGGTGKAGGDRHPKIGNNVLIGAGAKVLGNIKIGDCSRIAAGSVVLKDVPEQTTVAGVPAKIVGPAGCPEPARTMDHRF